MAALFCVQLSPPLFIPDKATMAVMLSTFSFLVTWTLDKDALATPKDVVGFYEINAHISNPLEIISTRTICLHPK